MKRDAIGAGYEGKNNNLINHDRVMENTNFSSHNYHNTSAQIGQQGLTNWTRDWYLRKTTAKTFKFRCSYFISDPKENVLIDNLLKFDSVVDVMVPMHEFEAVTTIYGNIPRTFMQYKPGNKTISIIYEENALGTVGLAIQLLQKSVSWIDGCVVPPNAQIMGDVQIDICDDAGTIIYAYIGRNVRFGGSEPISLAYTSKDTIKYKINWVVDYLDFVYDPTSTLADGASKYDVSNPTNGLNVLGQIAKMY